MSQDIVADGLNQIMNARRVEKKELVIRKYSKVLLNLFEMMKAKGHIEFEVNEEEKSVTVKIVKLNECRAIKPRYYVGVADIDKYLRRFLPSRNFGSLIVSTNKGLFDQKEAYTNKIGGTLIAYFY
ncbi:30S ribosomal protein S8 [archaeon]|mgnify:FL=1|jgi:small subunit ribosomal protein S8|nr:30S ribosomal protein S8 [archaeon]MBT3578263.1 30S ribosomal protein S8 [archaeon]MBT6819816.1 30S ribosomal protein S8 [archaeon]MBT6956608.1 30S ribosomal protein S8 [archaeon]MBT7025598.1 30S ribosomal protein S8 [archaeon]